MTDKAISPLRQRMIEDMTIRKFAPKIQHDYLQRVKNFAAYLGRSPDTADFEDLRRDQLHLAASGGGEISPVLPKLRHREVHAVWLPLAASHELAVPVMLAFGLSNNAESISSSNFFDC